MANEETTLPMNPNKNLTVGSSDLSIHELIARRRSIEQYIRILTKESIPTRFVSSDASYTTGKEIVLSSTVLEEHGYETACGVALHEATHVCITDMDFFNPKKYPDKIKYLHKSGKVSQEVFDACEGIVSDTSNEAGIIKFIANVVEDRRIDAWTFTRASGYKKFYMALYDSFFKNEEKTEGWTSGKYRNVNWQSYAFALVALTNDARDLTMLPDLDKIWDVIGIHDIGRLKNTEQAFVVSLEVFAIIKEHVDDAEKNGDPESQKKDDDASNDDGDESGDGDSQQNDSNEGENDKSEYSPNTGEENREANEQFKQTTDEQGKGDMNDEALKEAIKKIMHDFERIKDVEGMSENDIHSFEMMDASKHDDVSISTPEEGTRVPECNVVIIRGFNAGVENGMVSERIYGKAKMKNAVYDGFSMGRRMARKLTFRNEQRRLITSRQKTGKLDNSMVAEIGFSEHVFYTQQIDDYKDEFIHLTIDASGSMSGSKFQRATKAAVAIAVACKDIQGVGVQISFRGGTRLAGNISPLLFVAYDSRLHRINYIKKHFPSLKTRGQTPEGLTYDTIAKIAGGFDDSTNKYFINLSDGMPYFDGYSGNVARKHTKDQVTKLRRQQFNILSYFVSDNSFSNGGAAKRDFQMMYGRGAQFINVESVIEIAKTIMRIQRSKNKSY